jgi:NAD(P)-dependent dehydrogenase (short-subunit alcohol dehydrogenase family)
LRWETVDAAGTVLAVTTIRHSTDPYFQAHRPLLFGSVKLDVGPVVMARFAASGAPAGSRVTLQCHLDRSGEAVMVALPENTSKRGLVLPDPNREISGKTVLITGADGGIGRALVSAFLEAGAAEVIAAARRASTAAEMDSRVKRIALDITDAKALQAFVEGAGSNVDILVNNAGFTSASGLLDADTIDGARQEMDVNYFGTLATIRALAPQFRQRRQGVIVNVLSVLAHVCLPTMGSYCASKAATLSLTQGVRAELLPWGVRVCAIFPSTVDTPASADSPPPKLPPAQVAGAVIKMIQDGVEEAYPGSIASDLAAAIRQDSKTVEREFSMMLPEAR